MSDYLTVGEVAQILNQPAWRIARVADAVGIVERFAGYRAIPKAMLPTIIQELANREWHPIEQGAVA